MLDTRWRRLVGYEVRKEMKSRSRRRRTREENMFNQLISNVFHQYHNVGITNTVNTGAEMIQ